METLGLKWKVIVAGDWSRDLFCCLVFSQFPQSRFPGSSKKIFFLWDTKRRYKCLTISTLLQSAHPVGCEELHSIVTWNLSFDFFINISWMSYYKDYSNQTSPQMGNRARKCSRCPLECLLQLACFGSSAGLTHIHCDVLQVCGGLGRWHWWKFRSSLRALASG